MQFQHLIVPSSTTRKRALLLTHSYLAYYSIFIVALIFSVNIFIFKFPDVLGYATNINVNDLLSYTNNLREKNGLNTLRLNNKLSEAAKEKANDMFRDDYWAHISPAGKEPWDFIVASGYDYFYAGENLAVDFNDSKGVVEAWVNSATHRDNLLNRNYSEIGFAVVNGELQGRKTTLVVQLFGSPRNSNQLANSRVIASAQTEAEKPAVQENIYTIPENAPVTENLRPVEELFEKPVVSRSSASILTSNVVFNMSKYLAISLGLFLTALFAIDWYFVRKMGLLRMTGHTFLHILVLILLLIGIWYSNAGLIL